MQIDIFNFLKKDVKVESKYEIIDELIEKIFDLSEPFSNDNNEYPKSLHMYNSDIFYLDSARYEFERIIIRMKHPLHMYYNNKYKVLDEENEEEKCYANSLSALSTLFENFKQLYYKASNKTLIELNKACENAAKSLYNLIDILNDPDTIYEHLRKNAKTDEEKQEEYKIYLTYLSKETIIKDMHSIIEQIYEKYSSTQSLMNDHDFLKCKTILTDLEKLCDDLMAKMIESSKNPLTVDCENDSLYDMYTKIKSIKSIKKSLDVCINIMKMDYRFGQEPDKENFDYNMFYLKDNIDQLKNNLLTMANAFSEVFDTHIF